MWVAGKALGEAAGAIPQEDWKIIASTGEKGCLSRAQMEKVGEKEKIQLLWAWAHEVTTEFLPSGLRNDWEGENISASSESRTEIQQLPWPWQGCVHS